ncbi:Uncharacterised protein [Mycobacteroides abscessus subsp. abscessus]|nr:Uncharacterised protein [Mycobacteroides abscessus subsp. abscessus]
MMSGSIASGNACIPAYPTPATATDASIHQPGAHAATTNEAVAAMNSADARTTPATFPNRCPSRYQSGITISAGPTSATNMYVRADLSPRRYVATYCAPPSMTALASA